MRRLYESTFIINAGLEDPEVEAAINKVTSYIENQGGEIKVIEKWGRRRLAYPINKKFNGFYVHLEFELLPNVLPQLERFLVLEDTVIRHLTLQLSEKLRDLRLKKAMEEGNEAAAAEVIEETIVVETPAVQEVATEEVTEEVETTETEVTEEKNADESAE